MAAPRRMLSAAVGSLRGRSTRLDDGRSCAYGRLWACKGLPLGLYGTPVLSRPCPPNPIESRRARRCSIAACARLHLSSNHLFSGQSPVG
jgi:hypothetical protein